MEKAVNVAQYIYEEYKKIAQSNIDNMKLQKLLYFAQRESIAVTGIPMFSDNLEGWRYGPVCHEVWSFFAEHGIPGGDSRISDEAKYIINNVIQEYGSLESWKLSEMSHREISWQNARKGLSDGENGNVPLKLDDIRIDAQKVRPYDYVWDMYYDEFEDA